MNSRVDIGCKPFDYDSLASLLTPNAEEYVNCMRFGGDFHETSHELVKKIRKDNPTLFQSLDALAQKESKKWETVQQKGWNELKKKLDTKMQSQKFDSGKNYEDFRAELVHAIEEICVGTLKTMGIFDPGGHLASGTAGWDSDIDTVFKANPDLSEKLQVFEKLLFDMLVYTTFNDLPGVVFDTESYLDHTGSAFETIDKVTSPEGKKNLSYIEMNAYHLQMLRQCGGNGKAWKAFIDNELGDFGLAVEDKEIDSEHLKAVESSLNQVENFQREIDRSVDKLA